MVALKDKFFVIAENVCEVFDNASKRFVVLRQPHSFLINEAVLIDNKIMIIENYDSYLVYYDVEKDEWSEEFFDTTKDLKGFAQKYLVTKVFFFIYKV